MKQSSKFTLPVTINPWYFYKKGIFFYIVFVVLIRLQIYFGVSKTLKILCFFRKEFRPHTVLLNDALLFIAGVFNGVGYTIASSDHSVYYNKTYSFFQHKTTTTNSFSHIVYKLIFMHILVLTYIQFLIYIQLFLKTLMLRD